MRPVVSETTERLYAAIGNALTKDDEANDWALLHFIDSLASEEAQLDDIVRDSDDGTGWSLLFDVDRIPSAHLGYLAQFVGGRLTDGLTDSEQRALIRETQGFKRGTRAAIEQAAKTHLIEPKYVNIVERDGSAYQLLVQVYAIHTPDPTKAEQEVRRAKPAGIILTFEVLTGATYAELTAEHPGDYDALDAAFTDYDDMTAWVPV